MIKFVNLENGYIFDGNKPYIFWFDNEQSVDMYYQKTLCVISDLDILNVEIIDNNIFKLLNMNNIDQPETEICGFKYYDLNTKLICKDNHLTSIGTKYDDNYYIHFIYFIAKSENIGEYIEEFKINDTVFELGADFYNDNELLKINLSNFGLDISDNIQKSLYSANVHEDNKDNILLNRKYKELLSNYINILANKGSYKSLLNSLKWFEYKNIDIKEIWRQKFVDKYIYHKQDISSILEEEYRKQLNVISKTTDITISTALKTIIENDTNISYNNKTPNLQYASYKWSYEDMSLKMSLLGEFYKKYFMPIHLDLINSSIDDIVFMNPIILYSFPGINVTDFVYNYGNIICNIDNGVFNLDNVNIQVGPDTIFGTQYNNQQTYDDINIIGVSNIVEKLNNDNDLKTFYSQLYSGVGVVIPIHLEIPINDGDFIKSSQISYFKHDKWVSQKSYREFIPSNGVINIDFNILCTEEKQYDIYLCFETGSCKFYTKKIVFDVVDDNGVVLNLYKIRRKTKLEEEDLLTLQTNDYIYGIQPYNNTTNKFYTYYLNSSGNNSSIGINHLLILNYNERFIYDKYLTTTYFIIKKNVNDKLKYLICISKSFQSDYNDDKSLYKNATSLYREFIYKNIYHYIPQFHYLEKFTGSTIKDYTINDETLCVIPNIKFSKDIISSITEYEWEFQNISDNTSVKLNNSIKEPTIASNTNKPLSNGYYNIIFKYKLSNTIHEIKLNSAFFKNDNIRD